jgi:hypothetical protein
MIPMHRRTFLKTAAGGLVSIGGQVGAITQDANPRFPKPPPLSFREEKSGLKITGIRAVRLVPKRPLPTYEPTLGSWNTSEVEIANPLSVYPRFKPRRSLFYAEDLGPNHTPQRKGNLSPSGAIVNALRSDRPT